VLFFVLFAGFESRVRVSDPLTYSVF